jgi:hypothetical protein
MAANNSASASRQNMAIHIRRPKLVNNNCDALAFCVRLHDEAAHQRGLARTQETGDEVDGDHEGSFSSRRILCWKLREMAL